MTAATTVVKKALEVRFGSSRALLRRPARPNAGRRAPGGSSSSPSPSPSPSPLRFSRPPTHPCDPGPRGFRRRRACRRRSKALPPPSTCTTAGAKKCASRAREPSRGPSEAMPEERPVRGGGCASLGRARSRTRCPSRHARSLHAPSSRRSLRLAISAPLLPPLPSPHSPRASRRAAGPSPWPVLLGARALRHFMLAPSPAADDRSFSP